MRQLIIVLITPSVDAGRTIVVKLEQWSVIAKTGISVDELALINRYTYGSKWCNNYGYGIVDPYFGKIQDYGGLCQKYYPACNAALEKCLAIMVLYSLVSALTL